MAYIGQTMDNTMRYEDIQAKRRDLRDVNAMVMRLTYDWSVYDNHVKGLVANLVKARNMQPVDDPILQDIDDAIDALVDYVKVVVLIPKGADNGKSEEVSEVWEADEEGA